jgi:hypothetical protein
MQTSTIGRRLVLSDRWIDQAVTKPVPDSVSLASWPDFSGERAQIDVKVENHFHETLVKTEPSEPPGIERWYSYQMSQAHAIEIGILIGDDHDTLGLRHAPQLAKGRFVIAEVVEAAYGP